MDRHCILSTIFIASVYLMLPMNWVGIINNHEVSNFMVATLGRNLERGFMSHLNGNGSAPTRAARVVSHIGVGLRELVTVYVGDRA